MYAIRQFVCHGLILIGLSVSGDIFANSEAVETDGPRWACWYSPASLSVNCLLSRIPVAELEVRATEVGRTIDRRLPALVRTIWGSPEKLSGAGITIPLMTVPYEMDFVKMLAKSVMCGRRSDCSISFDPNKDGMAAVRAAALEAGQDWLKSASALRESLEAQLLDLGAEVIAAHAPRSPAIGAYRMPGKSSAAQLIRFDGAGIAVSAGSACSSGSLKASHVLTAMGVEGLGEVIRVSIGRETTADEIARFVAVWREIRG